MIPWIASHSGAWVFPLVCAVFFLAGIATAPFWPSLQTHAVEKMPELDQTMLYVLLSCAGVPGCGVGTLLMGWLGKPDVVGLANSFYIVPVCFVGILALLLWDKRKR